MSALRRIPDSTRKSAMSQKRLEISLELGNVRTRLLEAGDRVARLTGMRLTARTMTGAQITDAEAAGMCPPRHATGLSAVGTFVEGLGARQGP
jgi:hypothetical protein